MEVRGLTDNDGALLDAWLLHAPDTLLYASDKYRRFLKIMTNAEDRYLGAFLDGTLAGLLPLFIRRVPGCPAVVNSLPFYGSNGGFLLDRALPETQRIAARTALLSAYRDLLKGMEYLSATLVDSPFADALERETGPADFTDMRFGQITVLPETVTDSLFDNPLLDLFHVKTRNALRKPYKEGVTCGVENTPEAFDALVRLHVAGMESIGGKPKTPEFFRAVRQLFSPSEMPLYIARHQGRILAALLLFRFNRTVEYFTPASDGEARSLQPMSMLIFESMKQAVRDGYRYYNFGGTWKNQESLYRFKQRWGARDFNYTYHVTLGRPAVEVRAMGKAALLERYPYFFTIPFDQLEKGNP
ncbi:MAG: GNAT family N-acetyltransferase [Fibrobacterota bacterium]